MIEESKVSETELVEQHAEVDVSTETFIVSSKEETQELTEESKVEVPEPTKAQIDVSAETFIVSTQQEVQELTEESKVETEELISETKIEASETVQEIKESIEELKVDVQESSEDLKIDSELTESVQVALTESTESVKVEVQELAEEVEFKVEALAEEVKEMQELNQKVKAEMLESIDEIKMEVEQESESQDLLTEPLESEVPDLEMVQPSELEIQAPLQSLPLESPIELKQDIPPTPISETEDISIEPGKIMIESASYDEDKQEMQEFIEQVKINVQASSDQIGTEIQDTKDAIQDVKDYIGAIKANDIEIREYSPPVTVQIQESQGGDIKIVEHKVMEVEEVEETPEQVETFVESVDIPVETVQQELEKVIEPPLNIEVIDSLESTEPVKAVHFQDDLIEVKEAFEEQSIISEPKVQEHEPILVQQDVQMKFEQVSTASMQIDKEQTIPVDSIATTTIVTEEVIPEQEPMTFSTVEKVSAVIQEKEVTFEIPADNEKPLKEVTEELDEEVQTEIAEFLDDLVKEDSTTEVQKKEDEQVKSDLMKGDEDIDELFVLMMPPGQGSFDVKDHDETEFDENNAPRHSDDNTTTEVSVDEPLVGPALSMGFLVKQLDEKYAGAKEVEATPEIIVAPDPQPTSDAVQQSELMSSSMLKELTEDEQEDSGFEVRTKENKSMDESTGEPSLDLLQSDKTDSLFQSSTLNESAQTLSEHTLEAELPSDYDTTVQQDEVTLQLEQPKEEPSEPVEEEPELKATKGLKDSVHVTTLSPSKVISQEKQENVELIPNLNWDLKDKDELIPAKAEPTSASVDVQGLNQEQVAIASSSTSDSTSNTGTTSDGRTTSSSQEESSVPSSRMSERSGTQSSIELRTSSRSSAGLVESGLTSTTPSSSGAGSKASSVPPSGMSGISETSSSPQCSSSPYDEESRSTKARTTSGSSQETSSKKVTMTDSAQEYPLYDDDKSPTAQLRSSGECSPHSLPSSPRHLRRTVSNGVKKLTSEIFATDNDLSRSLEIVYSEPSSDERRKLSERYRHTSSSSGASNGSVNNEQKKVEKRKASVTQIRKTPDEDLARDSTTPCSGPESSTTTTTTDQEMKLQHSSEPLEKSSKSQDTSPIREKKTASPTKIQTPAPTSGSVQISSEDFTPMLQVECKTPECKTQTQG